MKQMKIKDFSLDRSLGYLIQNSTKDSTQEILAYFYGIATFVLDNLGKKSKAYWLDKHIVLFYKETPISFRIRIRGPGPGYRPENIEAGAVSIDVTYPKDSDEFNVADLMNAVVESGLGLTDEQNLPAFDKPLLKTPACLKQVRIAQDEQRRKSST